MDGKQQYRWMGKPILHPDDIHGLDREAALAEFGRKMPRNQAEEETYNNYVKEHREKAAGHHLRAMKTAQASGDMDASRKHAVMYNLHMKALGHNPYDRPPAHIESLATGNKESLYKFRAHKGDMFAVGDKNES